ncbi:MAG: ACT domain-containing protein, partial [Candidatus Latescibacteria bacterium]|nr:ACT domain-containing protein [Candidatus Latescibacterota bacterium]
IEQRDIAYASELGYRIKHLGITRKTAKGLELRVHPTLIPQHHNIAGVEGVMNALLVQTDVAGPMFYSGAGAGSKPTASSVVADIVDVVRVLTADPENRVPHLAFQPDALSDIQILSMEEVETACYLRIQMVNRPGALADVSRILGNLEINIETILQKESAVTAAYMPVIILTQRVQEKKMNEAISQI